LLSNRREEILKTIVEEYISYAIPVPSSLIKNRHGFSISSATIRNEMAVLEDAGYISRRHSSSGSLPTAKGYRHYVETVSNIASFISDWRITIRGRMMCSDQHVEGWTRTGAEILATLSGNLGLATGPTVANLRVRNFHLVYLNDTLITMVLIFDGAYVYKELVSLSVPVSIIEIEDLAIKLNTFISVRSINDIDSYLIKDSLLEQQVLLSINRAASEHYRTINNNGFAEGLRHLLAQPEFSDGANMIPLVEAVESGHLLQMISNFNLRPGEIRVIIGDENIEDAFKPMGMVLTGYGIPERISGIVGIIGPMRMHYHTTMSMVGYLSSVMSELIYEL
jgi:heat-inducible transcriptional repressor